MFQRPSYSKNTFVLKRLMECLSFVVVLLLFGLGTLEQASAQNAGISSGLPADLCRRNPNGIGNAYGSGNGNGNGNGNANGNGNGNANGYANGNAYGHEDLDCDDGVEIAALIGGGGGGGPPPLEFNVGILEPNIPDRFPGTTAMGDGYNPATGEITFSVVDISVPGNSAIPVELRRWIPTRDSDTGGPTGWKWDIPHIKGNYLDMKPGHGDTGWDWGTTTWHNGENCTGDSDSVLTNQSNLIASNMYWEGKLLHIPDVTSDKFLKDTAANPDREITKSNFKIETANCITNNPGGQEGIVVDGPNGLTYTFNEIKSYFNGKDTLKDPNTMTRILLVTKIEDRFGNDVVYSYDSTSNLTQILASDGRKITIAYQTVSGVKRPTTAKLDNSSPTADRTWTYNYQSSGGKYLESVTLPDNSEWEYSGLDVFEFDPNDPVGVLSYGINLHPGTGAALQSPACGVSSTNQYATVTTPAGAVIDYTFNETFHNRSDVEPAILWNQQGGTDGQARNMHCTVSLSLTERTVSGPGFSDMEWTYDYSENEGTYTTASGLNIYLTGPFEISAPSYGFPSMINTTTDVNYRTVTIDGPDSKSVFYIDRKFQSPTEGMVIVSETLAPNSSTLLERMEKTFIKGAFVGNHWYKCPCGGDYPPSSAINANQTNYRINQTDAEDYYYLTGGTDKYSVEYSVFNTHGTPTTVDESNDVNIHTRETVTGYRDGTSAYVVNQPTTVTIDSELISENSYDSNDQIQYVDEYGVQVRELSYNANGTLAWQENALGDRYSFASYKRGEAQTVTYPDLDTRTIVVDDNGWTTSFTDRGSHTWDYEYDPLGRLELIEYPTSDGVSRLDTTFDFALVDSNDLAISGAGLVTGQWKQTQTRGTFKQTKYFDTVMRNVLTRTEDTTDSSLTRYSRSAFDAGSRVVFASFPSDSAAAASGRDSTFDGLGRVTEIEENVTPYATTTYSYLVDNRVTVTNPRNKSTTTTYFAVGSPDQSAPTLIVQPEDVTTTIVRNNFGEMTSATQSGTTPIQNPATVSVMREYFYDSSHRLCRQIDPETGSTAYSYDDASQLDWYALVASGSTSSCDLGAVQSSEKIFHIYNDLDLLTNVNYPDGSPDLVYGYDDDGNLKDLTSDAAAWDYDYNAVHSLTMEELVTDSQTFTLTYDLDTMDRLTSITYPSTQVVSITPNAYGEPNSVGGYATDINYQPNGSIADLEYGNSREYSLSQNARTLPEELEIMHGASTVAKFTHTYDENANITDIADDVNGTTFDREMGYDDLDRLETAGGFWGSGANEGVYSYDALGNIYSKTESGIDLSYSYNATTNRLSSVTDSVGDSDYSFSYDAYGNVIDSGTHDFEFNLAGNLTRTGDLDIDYEYDGHKRRVQEIDVVATQTTYTVYSQSGTLMHKSAGGVSTDYVYSGSLLVAEKTGSTVDYMYTDLLGSPIAGNNSSAYKEHYRPWGEKKEDPIQLSDDVGYTGHQSDIETGLTYMQARYYDPIIGRFLSNDPVAFSSLNPVSFGRYSYANNNPYIFSDPDGREAGVAFRVINNMTNGGPVNPPPRTGPMATGEKLILGGLVAISIPIVIASGYEIGALAYANPATAHSAIITAAEIGAGDALGPTSLAAGAAILDAASSTLSTMGRAGRGRGVREVRGNSNDAKDLFNSLRGENPVSEVKPGVFTADGLQQGTVTFRESSKSGPPTVDVHGIEGGVRKIKFVKDYD